jgi:hypothetical protein
MATTSTDRPSRHAAMNLRVDAANVGILAEAIDDHSPIGVAIANGRPPSVGISNAD